MNRLILVSVFIVLFSYASLAQTGKVICPTVSVQSLPVALRTGENATFTASVSNITEKTEYVWAVDSGKIVEGQGTPTITVARKDEEITAEVELLGIPKECPRTTAVDTMLIHCSLPALLLDELTLSFSRIDIARLNIWTKNMENNPQSDYLISLKTKNKTPTTRKFMEKVFDYLSQNQQISKEKIYFSIEEGNEEIIRIFRIPQGAEFPECKKCELIKGSKF